MKIYVNGKYTEWFSIFSNSEEYLNEAEIDNISSKDSLIGWTCSNCIKRTKISAINEQQLRSIYKYIGEDIVRWRVVHSLGVATSLDSIYFLLEIVKNDENYFWTRFGAVRSLFEIIFFSSSSLVNPSHILNKLFDIFEENSQNKIIIKETQLCLTSKIPYSRILIVQEIFQKILDSNSESFEDKSEWELTFDKFKKANENEYNR